MRNLLMLALAILTLTLPLRAEDATISDREVLQQALEQALRENVALRAELEAARAELDRLRGGRVLPTAVTVVAPTAAATAERTHTVKAGETLAIIAAHYYGQAAEYKKIIEANRDKISSANVIHAGQVLRIP